MIMIMVEIHTIYIVAQPYYYWLKNAVYSLMAKGISWAEALSKGEKTKPVPLATYVNLNVSVRQLVSQSVENSIKLFFKIP